MFYSKQPRILVGKVFLFFILLLMGSCHYDSVKYITPVPPKPMWALDSSLFGENKYLTNLMTVNDSLLLAANCFSIWNISPRNINKSIGGNYIDMLQAESDLYPPTLSKDISSMLIDKDLLVFYPTKCASCLSSQIAFVPPYSTSTTSVKGMRGQSFGFSGGNKGGYPVIASRYAFVPFECEFSSQTASAALIKIDTAINLDGSAVYGPNLSLNSYKVINFTGVPTLGFFAAAYFNKFFVYDYNHTWRIDTVGNAKLLPGIYAQEMFTVGGRLFAQSINYQLYVSDDQGENWTLFSSTSALAGLQCFNIGNDLFVSRESQIWKVDIYNPINAFTELDNRGLETSLITSIAKCGKYAFVATTSGLFYKDTAYFVTPK